jgi:putative membrane protein
MNEPSGPTTTTQLAHERTQLAGDRTQIAQFRTLLSFERTRMAIDRTMMATLRTALSLVSFGFTIFSFFRVLGGDDVLGAAIPEGAPARFGLALVVLGMLVLAHGIWFDWASVKRLETERARLVVEGYLPDLPQISRSSIQMLAVLLMAIGVLAILSMAARTGPLSWGASGGG